MVSSDPAAGTDADQGSTVTLTVSTGPGTFAMPDVAGLTASNATALLESLGLTVTKVEASSDTVASGSVISSDPSGGVQVAPASSVVLTVSTGPAAPGPTSLADDRADGRTRRRALDDHAPGLAPTGGG